MYHLTAAVLTLILAMSLLACSGSTPPDPTATDAPESSTGTPRPTILSTRLTPIPTLTAAEQREWQQSRLATVEAGLPTLRPVQVVVYPTPPPLLPTLPPPPAPVLVKLVEVTPVPQPTVPSPPVLYTPVPPLILPTLAPPPTPPTIGLEPLWQMNYEGDQPLAIVLTPMGVEPVRGLVVECNAGDGEPWLSLRLIGEGVFPPAVPQYSGVKLTYAIDSSESVTTEWLPHPDTWNSPDLDLQTLYPSREIGTAIVNALQNGGRLMEVTVGDLQYTFETHGFPEGASPLIDSCQPGAAAPTSSPAPTSTPQPTPTPRPKISPPPTVRPVPTLVPPPSSKGVASEITEFAEACVDIRNRDESAPEWTFEGWVSEAQAVKVPPVLTEWWSSYVDQFTLQLTHDGPSKYSQEAADTTMDELALMDFRLRKYLVDAGCITGAEVWQADAVWAAWGRLLDGFGQGQNVSVEEFADACSDIKLTAPTLDKLIAIPQHMAFWWDKLNPPPELRDYYEAVADFYQEWIETGGGDPQTDVSFETQMAAIEAAQALDGDVLEVLLARRCAG